MAKSVLVVEDEPHIVLSLEFLLGQEGYDVRIAEDGARAIVEINKKAPDLMILDLMLPKIDGHGVCEQVRANAAWKSMTILVLSAKSLEADRKRALALGADDFVTKPFSNKDLIERCHKLLDKK